MKSGDLPTEGSFTTYQFENGSLKAFGCLWVSVSGDRAHIQAYCGTDTGGNPTEMELLIGGRSATLTGDEGVTRTTDRTVLKRNVPCYKGLSIEEICIDEHGWVLYFSGQFVGNKQTLEATEALPVFQPFGWPFDPQNPPTPTRQPTLESAELLQLPQQFHLTSP